MHLHDMLRKRSFRNADQLDAVFDALSSNKKEWAKPKQHKGYPVFPWQKKQTNAQLLKRYLNLDNSYITKLV